MTRFIDTNIFIYASTGHPNLGPTAREILQRIEDGEKAATSTLVLCEVAWILESRGRQSSIKPTLDIIHSFENIEIIEFTSDDLLVAATTLLKHNLGFNDAVNLAIMEREGITSIYTNDMKHLGRIESIQTVFK
ncbi:MAG: type II toxin-antitoxin system VapC family toxin [Candidatus Bathyarchaeota archaeon]|nr:type II toxin-antitoxin system VapC family toxin [Candidatus Bathyarchaeota archaeon]